MTLAKYLAVLEFNDGDTSFLKIFEGIDIKQKAFTSKGAQVCDTARNKLSAKKTPERVKKRKYLQRHQRKSYIHAAEENEGPTYAKGGF